MSHCFTQHVKFHPMIPRLPSEVLQLILKSVYEAPLHDTSGETFVNVLRKWKFGRQILE